MLFYICRELARNMSLIILDLIFKTFFKRIFLGTSLFLGTFLIFKSVKRNKYFASSVFVNKHKSLTTWQMTSMIFYSGNKNRVSSRAELKKNLGKKTGQEEKRKKTRKVYKFNLEDRILVN